MSVCLIIWYAELWDSMVIVILVDFNFIEKVVCDNNSVQFTLIGNWVRISHIQFTEKKENSLFSSVPPASPPPFSPPFFYFLVAKLLYKSKCPSVCQPLLGGNVIFSAPIWNRVLLLMDVFILVFSYNTCSVLYLFSFYYNAKLLYI